jgi:hypothetical protein
MNLGGIEGIKKVEISYFNPIPSQTVKIKSTFIRLSGNIFTAIATIYLVSAQIVGMYIVLNWLFS